MDINFKYRNSRAKITNGGRMDAGSEKPHFPQIKKIDIDFMYTKQISVRFCIGIR